MKSRLRRHRLNGSGDMKQRILKAMERLEDIDTRNAAVTQLELITRQLHDEHISTMLDCLGDVDEHQCASARKECMALMGKLSDTHPNLLKENHSRIIDWFNRNIHDRDNRVRESLGRSLGRVCMNATAGELSCLFKSLFHQLSNGSPPCQSGAAFALSEVLGACPPGSVQVCVPRLGSVLQRHLEKDQNTQVKRNLAKTLANLAQACAAYPDSLDQWASTYLTFLCNGLSSEDWKLCLECAITLSYWASSLRSSPEAIRCKSPVLGHLQKHKFHRVSHCRDAVSNAAENWCRISPSSQAISHQSRIKSERRHQQQHHLQEVVQPPQIQPTIHSPVDGADSDATEEFEAFEVEPAAGEVRHDRPSRLPASRESTPSVRMSHRNSDEGKPLAKVWTKEKETAPATAQPGASSRSVTSLMRLQRSILRAIDQLKAETELGFKKLDDRLLALEQASANVKSGVGIADTQKLGTQKHSPGVGNGLWNEVLFLMETDNVDDSFRVVLNANDEVQLVRLMGRVGEDALPKLTHDTCRALFLRILSLIESGNFIDLAFRWVHAALKHDVLKLLFPETLKYMTEALHHISHGHAEQQHRNDAARLHRLLKTSLVTPEVNT